MDVAVEVELENKIIACRCNPQPALPKPDVVDVGTRRVAHRTNQPPGAIEAMNTAKVGNEYVVVYDRYPSGSAHTASRVLIMAEVQRFADGAATSDLPATQIEGIHIPARPISR